MISKQKIFILVGASLAVTAAVWLFSLSPEPRSADATPAPARPTPDTLSKEQKLEAQKKEFADKWSELAGKFAVAQKFSAVKEKYKFSSDLRSMESYVEIDGDREDAFMEHLQHGRLPIFVAGDFDCDGQPDQAFLLDDGTFLVAFARGSMAAVTDVSWDALALGDDGGGDSYDGPFQAKCDYLIGIKFESAARAYVYDADKKKFAEYQTSD